jgi:hypothetical protein
MKIVSELLKLGQRFLLSENGLRRVGYFQAVPLT